MRAFCVIFLAMAMAAPAARADTVVVFAAASLGRVLETLAQRFEGASGHDVVISAAGSSALARQIGAGAPADLFVSASTEWMDVVQAQGLVAERVDLLGNTLVLVGPEGAASLTLNAQTDLVGALGGGRLSMALVDAVPAGQYGRQALHSLGLWDAVAPHVAQTDNVRGALTLVLRGEAPMGVVYASDIVGLSGVTVVSPIDPALHDPIVYPLALLAEAADPGDRAFWAYLQTPEARQVFAEAGFQPLGAHD